jgi:hypothetical protein
MLVDVQEALSEQRSIYVATGEYWFDTDPGEGNGETVLSMDGSFNNVIEAIIGGEIPSPVASGIHVLWLRVMDPQGGWGKPFGIVVNMDIDVFEFSTEISGPNNVCSGIEQLNVPYQCEPANGTSYNWSITGGTIITGQGTPTITVDWNAAVSHQLTLEQCIGTYCQIDQINVTTSESISVTNDVQICMGASYFAGGASQTTSGTYTDLYQNSNGCDSTVITNLSFLETFSINTNLEICEGDSAFLANEWQLQAGNYSDILQTTAGCDSIIVTTLNIISSTEQPIIFQDSEFTVFSLADSDSTTWIITQNACPEVTITLPGSFILNSVLFNLTCESEGEISAISYVNGCPSAPSQSIYFFTTNTEYHTTTPQLKISPNPTTGILKLQGSAVQANSELQVLNSVCKVILSTQIRTNETEIIDLTSVSAGMYWIKITSGANPIIQRLVIE